MTIANAEPIIGSHSGALAGTLYATRSPVTIAEQSLIVTRLCISL